ncbi:phage protein Gp36 family protein [uncultured Rhodospira sp.]|uniref:phage protein Gp36 family protein n=1 Tax=uncultured Rhodospira sp. TaxID=1936189 RepID=UPI002637316E|nr:phage protein Gp36 family protein [uncultured Rhodospira sp.]
MPYATASEMIAQIGAHEAEDLAPADGGGVDTAALDAALADAGEEIDGYLGGRYVLPTGVARVHCIAIARYRLSAGAPPDGRVGKDFDRAIAYLRDVAQGKTALRPIDTGGEAGGGGPVAVGPGRVFTDDTLRDY